MVKRSPWMVRSCSFRMKKKRLLIYFSSKDAMNLTLNFLIIKKIINKNYISNDKNSNYHIIIDSVLSEKELFKTLKNKIGSKNFIIRKK